MALVAGLPARLERRSSAIRSNTGVAKRCGPRSPSSVPKQRAARSPMACLRRSRLSSSTTSPLLHDDVMDRDLERRHRPTGWVVFGDGQAILAGNAMLTLAFDVLLSHGERGVRALPCLTEAVHQLISGQSDDLAFEGSATVDPRRRACTWRPARPGASRLLRGDRCGGGARSRSARHRAVALWRRVGHGLPAGRRHPRHHRDPVITGKSSSSDVRAGSTQCAGRRRPDVGNKRRPAAGSRCSGMADPTLRRVRLATELITEAGGLGVGSPRGGSPAGAAPGRAGRTRHCPTLRYRIL